MADKYTIYIKNGGRGHREILVDEFVDNELAAANIIEGEEADRVFEAFMNEYEKLKEKEDN